MPVSMEKVAEEMREKFPGIGFWPDYVHDRVCVSAWGIQTWGFEDFFISRKEYDDNLHIMKCERLLKALAEPYVKAEERSGHGDTLHESEQHGDQVRDVRALG